MKKFAYALMASCAMLFSFSSCEGLMGGGDDDDDNTTYGYADVKVTEAENTITFSYKFKASEWSYDYKIVWSFRDDKCTSCICTYNCPNAAVAAIVMESLDENEKARVTMNGSVLTIDCSEEYIGMTKQQISLAVNVMKEQIEAAQKKQNN